MTKPEPAPATLDIRNRVEFQKRETMVLLVMNDNGVPLFEEDLSQIISFLSHQRDILREERYLRQEEERLRRMEARN